MHLPRVIVFGVLCFLTAIGAGCVSDNTQAPTPSPGLIDEGFANLKSAEFYGLPDDATPCLKINDPTCPLRAPTADERQKLQQAISGLNCGGIQAILQATLDAGRITIYEKDEGTWGDSHRALDQLHVWSGTFASGMLASTLAHEGGHLSSKTVSKEASELLANAAEVACGTQS